MVNGLSLRIIQRRLFIVSSKTKPLLAILSLTIICILAMHEGINGQLYTVCVAIIGALGGVEVWDSIKNAPTG
jgi:hypothetical protein